MQTIKKVLIIDDDPDMIESLKMIMDSEGIIVEGASDEKECFGILDSGYEPDYIFLDLEMPSISGWDLLKEIKNHPAYSNIPVSMLTATPFKRASLEIEEVDKLVDYVTKPFTKKDILETLNQVEV